MSGGGGGPAPLSVVSRTHRRTCARTPTAPFESAHFDAGRPCGVPRGSNGHVDHDFDDHVGAKQEVDPCDKSTSVTVDDLSRGRRRPASRTIRKNRRSSGECPPLSTTRSSMSRHPQRPEPRSVSSRCANTVGEDSPRRTALSIAASIRWRGRRACARSMIVRVAEVARKPSLLTRSIGGSHLVVWT